MKTFSLQRWWRNTLLAQSISLYCFFGLAVFASSASEIMQSPAGDFRIEIGAVTNLAVRNLTSSFTLPFYPQLQFHHTGGGTITGSFTAGGITTGALSGRLSGSGSDLKLRLSSTQAFPDYMLVPFYGVMRKDTYTLAFDSAANTFSGIDHITETHDEIIYYTPDSFWEGHHTKTVHRRSSINSPLVVHVPEITDGSWELHLNIIPIGNKLSGTARITFPNAESFHFQLFGSYLPKSQTVKIVLRGTGEDKGATLMLSLVGLAMDIKSMRGTIGGQTIRYP
jgi:hypothetical protein